jgi:acyl-coenzyme A synthetase/AMP-(fatty) acid ligase
MSVPKIHAAMTIEQPFDLSCLRCAFTAGAPLSEDLYRWYEQRDVPVYEGWGLTETSPSAAITPPGAKRRPGRLHPEAPPYRIVGIPRDERWGQDSAEMM